MRADSLRRRSISTAAYFMVACVTLYWYANPYFCAPPRIGPSRLLISTKLALACSVFDPAAGLFSATVFGRSRNLQASLNAVLVGAGLASIPFWIYRGYGVFLFENTPADVSCFFTEGSGMAFPFVVAPALAVASFIREWMIRTRTMTIPRLPN